MNLEVFLKQPPGLTNWPSAPAENVGAMSGVRIQTPWRVSEIGVGRITMPH